MIKKTKAFNVLVLSGVALFAVNDAAAEQAPPVSNFNAGWVDSPSLGASGGYIVIPVIPQQGCIKMGDMAHTDQGQLVICNSDLEWSAAESTAVAKDGCPIEHFEIGNWIKNPWQPRALTAQLVSTNTTNGMRARWQCDKWGNNCDYVYDGYPWVSLSSTSVTGHLPRQLEEHEYEIAPGNQWKVLTYPEGTVINYSGSQSYYTDGRDYYTGSTNGTYTNDNYANRWTCQMKVWIKNY